MRQGVIRILAPVGLLGALGAGLGGCESFRSDFAAHEARIAEGAEIVDTAAGPVQVAQAGDGPAVLVLHGAGGGFDQGLLVADMLLADGYRVIAPSRFGYLDTPLPATAEGAGAEAQAEAHAALLDALGIERAAVVGFSAGSYSALTLALRRPERVSALILVVPALGPTDSPLANLALRYPGIFSVVRGIADPGYWALNRTSRSLVLRLTGVPPAVEAAAPAEQQAFAAALLDGAMPVSRRLEGLANDARTLQALEPFAFEELAAPTLAICARDDTLVGCESARRVAGASPQARLEEYDSGGHFLLGRHGAVRESVGVVLDEAGW